MKPTERNIVILLNGAGSSGKNSTARALQEVASISLLHVAMDAFIDMMPARLLGAPEGLTLRRVEGDPHPAVSVESGPVAQRAFKGMRHAVPALAEQGNNLVVDNVMLGDEAEDYRRLLNGQALRIVGLFAPLEVLEQRERSRGDREIGLARWQYDRVHQGIAYDLEIDVATSSPLPNAERIRAAFSL